MLAAGVEDVDVILASHLAADREIAALAALVPSEVASVADLDHLRCRVEVERGPTGAVAPPEIAGIDVTLRCARRSSQTTSRRGRPPP